MSIIRCTCGKQIDTDLEDFNFETNKCDNCESNEYCTKKIFNR